MYTSVFIKNEQIVRERERERERDRETERQRETEKTQRDKDEPNYIHTMIANTCLTVIPRLDTHGMDM